MPTSFSFKFDTPAYKGVTSFETGLFIDGKFVDGSEGTTIEVINPSSSFFNPAMSSKLRRYTCSTVSEGTPKDVDRAVEAAQKAFDTWGLNAPGSQRANILWKLAQVMEDAADELAALESLDNGTTRQNFSLTVHSYPPNYRKNVQLVPRNGCSLYYAGWADKHGGKTLEVQFLKPLPCGSPTDWNLCQTNEDTFAYTRHEPIGVVGQIIPWVYDEFLQKFTEKAKSIKIGDPFDEGIDQGPQISKIQYDRIMGYIDSGKADGAHVHLGGGRVGEEGYFIEPTIFTNVSAEMKIVKEEIFGPVGVIIKFEDEEDIVRQANDTTYGLAAAVFSRDINQAIRTTHKLKAGTVWVNCYNTFYPSVPFGGYKQSGIGRELGEYALSNYTNVKAVQINLGNA
ncbi:aldehyde dehydrogenase [Coprinopsis cinerea okayama7|uniref:Aldehyde dehydrogenase n=1 Tax=Coprinopsis cinerea (strain Okayama-7 / 130 / ATCC MYA-4618 / FGSC 9003) TaxID=240176 RepID=A8N4K9_COPC7|nr:aldehyde dehydrogenase [Coprinopsis cinerea okayama7\|eukprot:XP_001829778.2 aldehyde dehydrogenase [Coprinopsis cinerea okayama7\